MKAATEDRTPRSSGETGEEKKSGQEEGKRSKDRQKEDGKLDKR